MNDQVRERHTHKHERDDGISRNGVYFSTSSINRSIRMKEEKKVIEMNMYNMHIEAGK